jgi:hypothetical protein
VRRAFLCGSDSVTGFDFEHRRQWIIDRIKHLCSVFAVDLCAYAIMSNHYHIVVRINADEVKQWTDEEVAHRWMQILGQFWVQINRHKSPEAINALDWRGAFGTDPQGYIATLVGIPTEGRSKHWNDKSWT